MQRMSTPYARYYARTTFVLHHKKGQSISQQTDHTNQNNTQTFYLNVFIRRLHILGVQSENVYLLRQRNLLTLVLH